MTQASRLTRQELDDLAQVVRYLLLGILASFAVGVLGAAVAIALESDALFTLTVVLKSLIGLVMLALYFFMLRLSQHPRPWLYPALAFVLGSGLIGNLSLIVWIMIGVHISRVNQTVLTPKGFEVGLLGPRRRQAPARA
ncbi:hypothetical protein [Deinococcus ficus]|uniref:hypothetical protein n=1 Tax=Deinococcus ficus TaxID=317577 RepID=UPI00174B99CE|nr:hypothetical protein [Deinococcus ficus]GHF76174.1 hypothetical protein GCM10017782_12540 [Deinococcus ficus]